MRRIRLLRSLWWVSLLLSTAHNSPAYCLSITKEEEDNEDDEDAVADGKDSNIEEHSYEEEALESFALSQVCWEPPLVTDRTSQKLPSALEQWRNKWHDFWKHLLTGVSQFRIPRELTFSTNTRTTSPSVVEQYSYRRQDYSQRHAGPSTELELRSASCLSTTTASNQCTDFSVTLDVYHDDTSKEPDVRYTLTEPIHLELGVDMKHAVDFAYMPVEPVVEVVSTTTTEMEDPFGLEESKEPRGWWRWWLPRWLYKLETDSTKYRWHTTPFAGGSHGDVWRGRKLCKFYEDHCSDALVFKRLRVQRGFQILEAGLREVYFGGWLAEQSQEKSKLFTKYVDHFFREASGELELWIVYADAGPSLRTFLYSAIDSGEFILYEHSWLWSQLRLSVSSSQSLSSTEKATHSSNENRGSISDPRASRTGRNMMRTALKQILEAAAFLHSNGIVHRDIKPSNIMCHTNINMSVPILPRHVQVECVLGDFSSAWNQFSQANFYTAGPTRNELTAEYTPPEAFISNESSLDDIISPSYDSWSIGIVALEMLLGTPNVFSVDQRTKAIISNKMMKKGASERDIKRALYL
jgi:hypothetical protein